MFNASLTEKYVYPGDFAVNIPAVGKKNGLLTPNTGYQRRRRLDRFLNLFGKQFCAILQIYLRKVQKQRQFKKQRMLRQDL